MSVRSALEAIKPDDRLIYDTEKLLRSRSHKNKFRINKLVAAACLPFILGALYLSFVIYNLPVSYVSFDVNPSFELEINRFDRVVDINYFNNDAKSLVSEKELYALKPAEAINVIMDKVNEKGYLSSNSPTFITIGANSDTPEKSIALLEEYTKHINNYSKPIIVISDTASRELKEEAEKLSLSFGKLNLIRIIQQLNPSVKLEDLKDASITAIMADITYLTSDEYLGADANTKLKIRNYIQSIQISKDADAVTNNPVDGRREKANSDARKAQDEAQAAQAAAEAESVKAEADAQTAQTAATAEKAKAEADAQAIQATAEAEKAKAEAEAQAIQAAATAEKAKAEADAQAIQATAEAEKARAEAEAQAIQVAAEAEKAKAEAEAQAIQATAEAEKAKAEAEAQAIQSAAEAEKARAEAEAQAIQSAAEAEKARAEAEAQAAQ